MKIKIIDLLNLVYEKKAPKQVLYKYCEYEFNYIANDYENNDGLALFSYLFQNEEQALWIEIEIIEERPKEIEKDIYNCHFKGNGSCYIESKGHEYDFPYYYVEKINEIIDKVNYLLKKEEDKK